MTGSRVDLFDGAGRLTAIVEATTGARLGSFAWGAHGLVSVSDRSGTALVVVRATDGTPTRLEVPGGAATNLGVVAGRLSAVGYPSGSLVRLRSAANGLLTDWEDAAGNDIAYSYDGQGRLTGTTNGAGTRTTYERDLVGDTLTVHTRYPGGSQAVDLVSVAGGTTTRTHTEPSGAVTTMAVTGLHRTIGLPDGGKLAFTLAPDPRWGTDAPIPAAITGDRDSVTSVAPPVPAAGAVVPSMRTVTVDGHSWSYGYDPATRTASSTDPGGGRITAVYDQQGRVMRRDDGGLSTGYGYDGAGRLARVTLGVGPDARTWTYGYSPGVVTVTDPMGGVQKRSSSKTGAITSIAGPGSSGLTLGRDPSDQLTGFAAPGSGSYALTLRADGQPAAVNSPAGQGGPQFTGYNYDDAGQLIKVFTGQTALTITRDDNGRIASYDTGTGSQVASYDDQARLTGWRSAGIQVSDGYTGGVVTAEKTVGPVSGSVSRTVDASGRTSSENVDGTSPVTYTYDSAGDLAKAGDLGIVNDPTTGRVLTQSLGSLVSTFSINQFGETTAERIAGPGGRVVAQITYERDHLGRVTAFDTATAGHDSKTVYSYDAAGRIAAESTDGSTYAYVYDPAGNLISTTDSAGRVTRLTYDARNALLARGSTSYTYDSAGRLSSSTSPAGTSMFHYDANGSLLSVQRPGKPEIGYTVDGFGRRIVTSIGAATVSGVLYRDSARPAAELNSAGAITKRYVYDGNSPLPAYVVAGGIDYLEVPDATGGPGMVINSTTGQIADQVSRTAFGTVTKELVPGWQLIGFAGGITDPATSLVRFGARDYDTGTGRWTAPDPLGVAGGSANLYEYVGNDPINRSDESGTSCDYYSVGLSGAVGVGPLYVSFTTGIAYSNGQVGTFNTSSTGSGFGGGGSLVYNCMDKDDHSSPGLDDFSGRGASIDGGGLGISGGRDTGYDSTGRQTSSGWHAGFGAGTTLGGSVTSGWTSILCLRHCPPEPCVTTVCNPDSSSPSPISDPCISGCGDEPAKNKSWWAAVFGDPHFRTADGVYYNMQGVGEFDALTTDPGDLTVQLRDQPMNDSRYIAMTTAVAMSVNGDRLEVNSPAPGRLSLSLTGGQVPDFGSFTLPHGARVTHLDHSLTVTLADGTQIAITPNPRGLDVTADLAATRRGHVHGLYGPFNGSTGDLLGRDGSRYSTDDLADYDTLYGKYIRSWRVSASESLFTYAAGQSTSTFTDLTFPDRNPPAPTARAQALAEQICRQADLPAGVLPGCVMDVAVTGDAGFASSAASGTGAIPGAVGVEGADQGAASVIGDIAPGATVHGALLAGAQRAYTFTVPAGTVAYFVAATNCQALPAGSLRSYVLDDQGAHVTGETDICADPGRVQLTKAGTYRLVVTSADGGAGPYSLTWRASAPDLYQKLGPGTTVSATVGQPGGRDVYPLAVTAGTIGFFAASKSCADSTSTALHWYILDPAGNPYTGESGICADLGRVQFTSSGTYQLIVASNDGGTGSYRISWQRSRSDLVKPLAAGGTATGNVAAPGSRDIYTLAVTAGTVGYFAAAKDCAASMSSTLHWYLLDPSGAPASGELEICGDQGRIQFANTGNYQLVVSSNDGGTGSYGVTWQASRPDQVRPLVLGSVITGAIDTPGSEDRWTFSASANAMLHFGPAAGCAGSGLYWAVQDSTGTPISGRSSVCDGSEVVTIPTTGSYQVLISGDGAATGTYSFTLGPN